MTTGGWEDRLRLRDILVAMDELEQFTSVGRRQFLQSPLHQRAVDKDLEIIGEPVRHLSGRLKEGHPEVEWRALEHLRDSLVHECFHADPTELWRLAAEAVPSVKERLRKVRG